MPVLTSVPPPLRLLRRHGSRWEARSAPRGKHVRALHGGASHGESRSYVQSTYGAPHLVQSIYFRAKFEGGGGTEFAGKPLSCLPCEARKARHTAPFL